MRESKNNTPRITPARNKGTKAIKKIKTGKCAIYIVLAALSVASLFPFVWMLRSSFMSPAEIFAIPTKWLPSRLSFDNYVEAFSSFPFLRYTRNSLFLVTMCVIGNILSCSLSAYGFARLPFRFSKQLFFLLLATMMIPGSVLLIPQFMIWRTLGAYNTYWPLILPSFLGNAFFIFLLRQLIISIPKDYDESALIDGAGYFRIYWSIILPLSKPGIATVGIFTFMGVWNDFFGPLIYLSSDKLYTISIGLLYFMDSYDARWDLLMAASMLVILPVIIMLLFTQRYFIKGINFTGIKG